MTRGAPAVAQSPAAVEPLDRRMVGLDGLRGLAAVFVVLHHTYLISFPGFPRNTGPVWLAWLLYGHFAVVVFISLSGFSLALSPARKGWQLGGKAQFAQRRAWRILPAYWAALAFSLAIAWGLNVPQPGSAPPDAKSVFVYGLLVQDVFGSPVPNGAFWTIAVESQLYVVFPLLLVLMRRYGPAVMLVAAGIPVAAIGLLAPHVSVVDKLMRLTPQFAWLFAIGIVAAGIMNAGERIRRLPLHRLSGVALVPVVVAIALLGPVRASAQFFWITLSVGPSIALLLAAFATRRPAGFVRMLESSHVRKLGTFSYSLYLVHAPIVVAVATKIVEPRFGTGQTMFWVTLAIVVPLSIGFGWVFSEVFEAPFRRYRSWTALTAAIGARLSRLRAAGRPEREPAPVPRQRLAAEPVLAEPVTET